MCVIWVCVYWISARRRPEGQTTVAAGISAALAFISLRPKPSAWRLRPYPPVIFSLPRRQAPWWRLPGCLWRFAALSRCVSSVATGTEPEVAAHMCVCVCVDHMQCLLECSCNVCVLVQWFLTGFALLRFYIGHQVLCAKVIIWPSNQSLKCVNILISSLMAINVKMRNSPCLSL